MYLHDLGIVCPLGTGKFEVWTGLLRAGDSAPSPIPHSESELPIFAVETELPELPHALGKYDCRNNRLLLAAARQIEPALERAFRGYGPERMAVVIGTSASGIAEGEKAVEAWCRTGRMPAAYHYKQQELGGAAEFVARCLGIRGPAFVVSTSCSCCAGPRWRDSRPWG